MSIQSQQNNMIRLHELLKEDLGFIAGERERGPNGAKKTFLHVGKVFLRALAKDLGLRDAVIKSNPGGMAVSGDCSLCGMWENNGIYICISQFGGGGESVILYRAICNRKDCSGRYNHYFQLSDLKAMNYKQLLYQFSSLRRDYAYAQAA